MDNVAAFLPAAAAASPERAAIVAPAGGGWRRVSYRQLDERSDAIAAGLHEYGVARGETTLVMVRAGIELITLFYALLKLGAVPVLIDPGMGRKAFLRCVSDTRPTAFVGIPLAQLARLAFRSAFRSLRRVVTVGRRLFWSGPTLEELARAGRAARLPLADVGPEAPAAILFTSGSTGPAKGALYSHRNFAAQVALLKRAYGFAPGEVDLAAFPLFSLFDCALQMTSVIPELDPSRPASCDPAKLTAALEAQRCTTAFGSPAIWRRVAPYALAKDVRFRDLRRVLIAGAPVPPSLVEQLQQVLPPAAEVHTPYGATEALPVASIAGHEILAEATAASRAGRGTCVGRPVAGVEVRILRIDDAPIPNWSETLVCAPGEVGEIAVKGPVVTLAYHNRPEATAAAKIRQGDAVWHRMGDLGCFDERGRLWFAGRKSERVRTSQGTLFTDFVEGRIASHPAVSRCALVGVGEPGQERPVLIVEGADDGTLAQELRGLFPFEAVLFHPRFPVDARHNAKIQRHVLRGWAAARLAGRGA